MHIQSNIPVDDERRVKQCMVCRERESERSWQRGHVHKTPIPSSACIHLRRLQSLRLKTADGALSLPAMWTPGLMSCAGAPSSPKIPIVGPLGRLEYLAYRTWCKCCGTVDRLIMVCSCWGGRSHACSRRAPLAAEEFKQLRASRETTEKVNFCQCCGAIHRTYKGCSCRGGQGHVCRNSKESPGVPTMAMLKVQHSNEESFDPDRTQAGAPRFRRRRPPSESTASLVGRRPTLLRAPCSSGG